MATGDHIQTAIAVGKECGIVPSNVERIGILKINQNLINIEYDINSLTSEEVDSLFENTKVTVNKIHMFKQCGINNT